MTHLWAVSGFRNVTDNKPARALLSSWAYFTRPRIVANKADVPLWSPAWFDGTRSAANARDISALVLDYDGGATLDEARRTWATYAYVLHTSHGHRPDAPRFRVILPFDPCRLRHRDDRTELEVYAAVWQWAYDRTGRAIDRACSDPGRIWYAPSAPARDLFVAELHPPRDGIRYLDPLGDEVPRMPDRTTTARRRVFAPVRCGSRAYESSGRDRYAHDPAVRRKVADLLGANVHPRPSGEWAKVTCPGCGRVSLAWAIDPDRMTRARCDHRDSCDYSVHLFDLVRGKV